MLSKFLKSVSFTWVVSLLCFVVKLLLCSHEVLNFLGDVEKVPSTRCLFSWDMPIYGV